MVSGPQRPYMTRCSETTFFDSVKRGIADECVKDEQEYAARKAARKRESNTADAAVDDSAIGASSSMQVQSPPIQDTMPWDEALFSSFFYDQDLSRALLGSTPISDIVPPMTIDGACEAMFTGSSAAPAAHTQERTLDLVAQRSNNEKRTSLRQRVKWFEPLPFRKGYASILRHLQEQHWQPANVASVQQALASVCALWYRREDVMQLSDLIQVQAQWATNLVTYRDQVLPHSPIAMLACRKAGEIYAANEAALRLLKRPATDFEDGVLSVYQMMTEQSAAHFFRLYERAIREKTEEVHQTTTTISKDYGSNVTLYWDADLTVDSHTSEEPMIVHTRGVFHIKFSNLELPVSVAGSAVDARTDPRITHSAFSYVHRVVRTVQVTDVLIFSRFSPLSHSRCYISPASITAVFDLLAQETCPAYSLSANHQSIPTPHPHWLWVHQVCSILRC
jgi:hypothetical protein